MIRDSPALLQSDLHLLRTKASQQRLLAVVRVQRLLLFLTEIHLKYIPAQTRLSSYLRLPLTPKTKNAPPAIKSTGRKPVEYNEESSDREEICQAAP